MRPAIVLVLVLAAVLALGLGIYLNSGDGSAGGEGVAPVATVDKPATPRDPANLANAPDVEDRAAATPEAPVDETDPEAVAAKGNSLVGLVVSAEGKPIPKAKVLLSRNAMMGESLAVDWFLGKEPKAGVGFRAEEATTNSKGQYQFFDVKPANDYFLMASHADYSQVQEEMVQVAEAGESAGPRIVLREGSKLTGYVLDVNGGPVPEAQLHLDSAYMMGMEQKSPDRLTVATDESGYYSFRNVAAGARILTVQAEGYGTLTKHDPSKLNFDGQPGDNRELSITLDVGHPIAGRVAGPDDEPVVGAKLIAMTHSNDDSTRADVVSDEDGLFQFNDLRQGSYILMIEHSSYRVARANRVQTGDMNLRIDMLRLATVGGRVYAATSGEPIEDFTCAAHSVTPNPNDPSNPSFEPLDMRARTKNSADGSFEIDGFNPGTYVLKVTAKGFAPRMSEPFTVIEDQPTPPIEVGLSGGGSIRGRVLSSDGSPVRGAVVSSKDDAFEDQGLGDFLGGMIESRLTTRKVRTDADGNFEMKLLNPGRYMITIEHKTHSEGEVKGLNVSEGGTVDAGTISLKSGGEVKGTVFSADGSALGHGWVQLYDPKTERTYRQRTDTEGRYKFEHVRPGAYQLSATHTSASGGGDAFAAILDQEHSKVQITVVEGVPINRDLNLGN